MLVVTLSKIFNINHFMSRVLNTLAKPLAKYPPKLGEFRTHLEGLDIKNTHQDSCRGIQTAPELTS